jgi:hypothetical protein
MPKKLDGLLDIERRYTGPIPADERWVIRMGSRAAVERARAKAAVRFLRDRCVRLVKNIQPTPALHDEVRRLLAEQAKWHRAASSVLTAN